jgi:hypothetical protein
MAKIGGCDHWDRGHVYGGRHDWDCRPKGRVDWDRGHVHGGRHDSDCRPKGRGDWDCRPARPGGDNCNRPDRGFDVDECNNTVETDRYLISASGNRDGELTIKDKLTGKSVTAWGDPHLETDNDKADFSRTFTLMLKDGTKITIDPTDINGASYLGKVTISTKDGNAAVIRYDGDHNPRTEQLWGDEARSADCCTPDGGRVYTVDGDLSRLRFGPKGPELIGNVGNIDNKLALTERQRHQFSRYWG